MSISEALVLNAAGASAPRTAGAAAWVSPKVIAREAVVAAVLVVGLTALLSTRNLGAGLVPHPGWAAVILLSARYGSRGFGFALLAVWGTLALGALGMGMNLGLLMTAAGNSVPNLTALMLSVMVAWIASSHEQRIGDLSARAATLTQKSTDDGATIVELRDAALALRARADRMDHSLSFLRDVTARLESGEPLVGWQAALDLAIARTGARAGVVQVVDGQRLRTIASLGAWTAQRPTPPDTFLDRTIAAAFESAAAARALDLPDAGRDDSDVATPVVNEAGQALGVLALRGVPADSLSHALVHDLGLITQWCAQAGARRLSRMAVEKPSLTQAPALSLLPGAIDASLPRPQAFN